SPERQMGILRPVVGPTTNLAIVATARVLEGGPVGSEPVSDQPVGTAVPLHGFPDEFQRCPAIARPGHEAFQHLALVVDGAPEIVLLAVDLHEYLVEMPPPAA